MVIQKNFNNDNEGSQLAKKENRFEWIAWSTSDNQNRKHAHKAETTSASSLKFHQLSINNINLIQLIIYIIFKLRSLINQGIKSKVSIN